MCSGGAVLFHAFDADPGTANVRAMFRPVADVYDAVKGVGA